MRVVAPVVPVPMRAPTPAVPPSASYDAAVDRYLAAPLVASPPPPARRSREDRLIDLQVKSIMSLIEDLSNGIPEEDNDGAACGGGRRHRN